MIKFIRYIVLLFVVALSGCTKVPYDVMDPQEKVYISLNATPEYTADVESKAAGVVESNDQFADDNVALYAVKYALNAVAPYDFSTANRVINTVTATIEGSGVVKYGVNNVNSEFPDSRVAVYGVFPSDKNKGVEIKDNGGAIAPSAKVTLKIKPLEQYDVMIAKNENLDRMKHPTTPSVSGKNGDIIVFEHSLAQLIVKIYADDNVQGANVVSKVGVTACGIANLTDITKQGYSDRGADSEFVLHELPATIVATTKETAQQIGTQLMLFPGAVTSVNLTIDGNLYVVAIPKSVVLEQGKKNTIRLKLTRLGVKFGGFSIAKWEVGTGGNGNAEVVRRKTAFDIELKNVGVAFAATASATYTAEVQINDSYWLASVPGKPETTKIACAIVGSRLKFSQSIETLMMTEDDILLTKLKIYENGTIIFDGKISSFTPASVKMVINQATGAVTIGGAPASFDIGFGNFGTGLSSFPFEVDNAIKFDNIRKFYASTRTSALFFVQTGDVDLAPHLKIDQNLVSRSVEVGVSVLGTDAGWAPIAPVNGSLLINYDGKGCAIKGMYIKNSAVDKMSLFGTIRGTSSIRSVVKNLRVLGNIQSKLNIGGFAAITDYADFANCKTAVNIDCNASGTGGEEHNIGGMIGDASRTTLVECGSYGTVGVNGKNGSATSVYLGGLIGNFGTIGCSILRSVSAGVVSVVATQNSNIGTGGMLGQVVNQNTTISDCYNRGTVSRSTTFNASSGSGLGGLIGLWDNVTLSNCYNSGVITSPIPLTKIGTLIGGLTTASKATVVNCHHVSSKNSGLTALNEGADVEYGIGTTLPSAATLNAGRDVWVDGGAVGPKLKWEE